MPVPSFSTKTARGSANGLLLDDLLVRLGWTDAARADHLLRATLRGIQARLPESDFASLVRGLPSMVRTACHDQVPSTCRTQPDHADDDSFVAQIRDTASGNHDDIVPKTVSEVFAVLAGHIFLDEGDDISERLAHRLLDLWPTDF